MQVTVKHVHIRYEDNSNPERPFSLGFSIEQLSAVTTDQAFREQIFTVGQDTVYKRCQLKNVSVYLNPVRVERVGM